MEDNLTYFAPQATRLRMSDVKGAMARSTGALGRDAMSLVVVPINLASCMKSVRVCLDRHYTVEDEGYRGQRLRSLDHSGESPGLFPNLSH